MSIEFDFIPCSFLETEVKYNHRKTVQSLIPLLLFPTNQHKKAVQY